MYVPHLSQMYFTIQKHLLVPTNCLSYYELLCPVPIRLQALPTKREKRVCDESGQPWEFYWLTQDHQVMHALANGNMHLSHFFLLP